MRFNHMELTFARGTLDTAKRDDIKRFYGDVLGWNTLDVPLLDQMTYYLSPDDGQFILLAESDRPISSPGYDHLGLLLESRDEVDTLLEQCRKFRDQDSRMKIKEYDDLVQGPVTVRAFYVKYLLPIYFDIQHITWEPGSEPERSWRYT
jgi:predicted enzyme related to lactoylglutathione lyase